MFAACKEIAYKIRTASCDKMACFNEFGDEQLAIDILANNVLFQVRFCVLYSVCCMDRVSAAAGLVGPVRPEYDLSPTLPTPHSTHNRT